MFRRRSRLAVVVTAALLFALPTVTTGASPSGWGDPVRIRTQSVGIEDLRVGVDGDGRVGVVGHDGIGLFAMAQASAGWRFTRLVADGLVDGGIAGVFDRAGHAWLVYRHGCDGSDCTDAGLYLFTNRHGGPNDGWPDHPTLLASGTQRDPAFQVSADGRLHLASTDKHGRLHYATATSARGPWTDVLVWGQDGGHYPAMVLDADGHPNLVAMRFPATLPGSFGIGWARDVGTPGSPSFRTRMAPRTGEFDGPAMLALDADGHARIIWRHDPYCGVAPCPPEPSRGTWTRAWTGSGWTGAKQLSGADPAAIRITAGGRVKVLTHRPSVVAQAASGWDTTVLVRTTVGYGHYVEATAMALTETGKARVVYADWLPGTGGSKVGIYLVTER